MVKTDCTNFWKTWAVSCKILFLGLRLIGNPVKLESTEFKFDPQKYFCFKMDRECYLGKHRYGAESDLHTVSIETPSFITYSMELPHDPTDFNKKSIRGLRIPAGRTKAFCARMYLKLPLRQWGASNVYLLVFSS